LGAVTPHQPQAWVKERIGLGKNLWGDSQLQEALACAAEMVVISLPYLQNLGTWP
jgi:hypothetical protein